MNKIEVGNDSAKLTVKIKQSESGAAIDSIDTILFFINRIDESDFETFGISEVLARIQTANRLIQDILLEILITEQENRIKFWREKEQENEQT